jgi:hypothetical protein
MRRSSVAGPLLAALLLAGCSAAPDHAAGGTTASASSSAATSTAGSAPTTGTAGDRGCPASGQGVPNGADSAPTLDVDGDGHADTEWIARAPAADGSVRFGVTTRSGGTFTGTIRSASPVRRSVLVADVTGKGELIALASDGRQVLLYAISQCALIPVQNAQGAQYAFDLGFTGYGTGVGCVDVDGDGVRDLAGLLADGTTVTRTAVELHGPRATNGRSATTASAPPAQLDLAHQVTCGDLTLTDDGVSSNR